MSCSTGTKCSCDFAVLSCCDVWVEHRASERHNTWQQPRLQHGQFAYMHPMQGSHFGSRLYATLNTSAPVLTGYKQMEQMLYQLYAPVQAHRKQLFTRSWLFTVLQDLTAADMQLIRPQLGRGTCFS